MSSKERFITAMMNQIPDRVPCAPDISNYIPCKKTGLPFWEIYFRSEMKLWEAYVEAANFYQMDYWIASAYELPVAKSEIPYERVQELTYDANRDAMIAEITYITPDGKLSETQICYRHEPPAHLTRIIKDIEKDWKKFRWLLRAPEKLDQKEFARAQRVCADNDQAFGCTIGYPGFHMWEGAIEGGIEALTYLYYDNPALLDRWFEEELESGTQKMNLLLELKPDYLLFGGSGTLTMASPELARRYALPALNLWSKMAKEAGVPTMLHSCGKSRLLIDMLIEDTEINCVNPLEMPPMGDTDLAEVKQSQGKNIALMGNLHTTDTMLYGSADDVYKASLKAMEIAKEGGGFILSTGDQCPYGTPDENLLAMVQAVEDAGYYDK